MKGFVKQRTEGGSWTAYWEESQDPGTGKRRQHSKAGFRTKGAAQKHLNVVVGKVSEGTWRPDRALTVAELVERHWLPAQRARGLRASTLSQYELAVRSYLVPALGATKVAALTPADVNALVEKMATTKSANGRDGLSSRTRQVAVGTLKAATTSALANGMLGRDPLVGYQRPRLTRSTLNCWTNPQARQFLTAVKGDRLEVAWALLLTRGLRRGDMCGLRWDRVDLEHGTLQIVRTRISVDGVALEGDVKTDAGRRTVPLDSYLVTLLRAHRKAQLEERLRAGDAWQGEGHLVTNELGEPYHPDAFSKRFRVLVKRSGLPAIRLHDCRHTAASLMLADGVQPKVVQEMLGHASVQITLAIYGHTTPTMGREAGAALSAKLLGSGVD